MKEKKGIGQHHPRWPVLFFRLDEIFYIYLLYFIFQL